MSARPFARVLNPGPYTLVQDQGRSHLSQGVPQAGPMDPLTSVIANRVLGNDDLAPLLEVTLNRLELEILAPIRFCLAGWPGKLSLNQEPIPTFQPFEGRPGDLLSIAHAPEWRITNERTERRGARSYLACQGGIAEHSTFQKALGSLAGRLLKKGDELHAPPSVSLLPTTEAHSRMESARRLQRLLDGADPNLLHYIPHRSVLAQYLDSASWKVLPDSSRMGIRFAPTSKVPVPRSREILSQATFFGVIQITPMGNPIVLGADAQTTGGYPIAGCVATADFWKCGQLLPGQTVRFAPVSARQARALLRS